MSRATILVVDDEPEIRRLLCEHLTAAGHVAVEAKDGHQALDHLLARGHEGQAVERGLAHRLAEAGQAVGRQRVVLRVVGREELSQAIEGVTHEHHGDDAGGLAQHHVAAGGRVGGGVGLRGAVCHGVAAGVHARVGLHAVPVLHDRVRDRVEAHQVEHHGLGRPARHPFVRAVDRDQVALGDGPVRCELQVGEEALADAVLQEAGALGR